MKIYFPRAFTSRLCPLILMTLTLGACGPGFERGVYAVPGSNQNYEFGPGGRGELSGAVTNVTPFTYEVDSERVLVIYEQGMPEATFWVIDSNTLEREDGERLVLRE